MTEKEMDIIEKLKKEKFKNDKEKFYEWSENISIEEFQNQYKKEKIISKDQKSYVISPPTVKLDAVLSDASNIGLLNLEGDIIDCLTDYHGNAVFIEGVFFRYGGHEKTKNLELKKALESMDINDETNLEKVWNHLCKKLVEEGSWFYLNFTKYL